MGSAGKKRFCIRSTKVLLSLFLSLTILVPSAQSATPRQTVSSSLNSLSSHTDQLVQQVQAFLQAGGRWSPAPQGKDMQLCQALQDFQKKVGKMKSDNGGQPYDTVHLDLQLLQFQGQVVEQLLSQVAQSPMVSAAWMQVRNDVLAIGQAMYLQLGSNPATFYDGNPGIAGGSTMPIGGFVPGVPTGIIPGASGFLPGNSYGGNPYAGIPTGEIPGNIQPPVSSSPFYPLPSGSPFYPGLNPTNINITENSTFDPRPSFQGSFNNFGGGGFSTGVNPPQVNSTVYSNLNGADQQSERFVKQLSSYLQMKGQWPPAQGSNEMNLCQNVQAFQLQLRRLKGDLQSNQSYALLQTEMRQMGAASQSIDQLLVQIGVSPDVTSRWNEVRSYMNGAYQSFFSAGSGGYMWMR